MAEVEQEARQSLHGYYEQAKQQHRLQEVLSALQHKIQSQAQRFGLQLPATQVLEQLIEGYSETDAVRHLRNVRDRIQQAIEKQQVASCNYVDDNRRRSTIEILSLAFNCKGKDCISLELSTENLGEILQALKDDYVLLNYTGQALSQAMIQESYLNLRLEELKFAALVLQLKQDHLHPYIA